MIRLGLQVNPADLAKVQRQLSALSGGQLTVALGKAFTDTAFTVRNAMVPYLQQRFDRPTPFIYRSPKVIRSQGVKADGVTVEIAPTLFHDFRWSKGGKLGVDPQDVLQAQALGGRRRDKKSEAVLRRAGWLPAGYQTAIPKDPYPGSVDGFGNISGNFIRTVLSYLQAFGEEGARQNMGERRRKRLEDRTLVSSLATRQTYRTIRGVVFFVSMGRLRSRPNGTYSSLAPGIWAKSGLHGSKVQPVLMFVRSGQYRPLIDMDGLAASMNLPERLGRAVRHRIREAAENAVKGGGTGGAA